MPGSTASSPIRPRTPPRRLILGTALALALLAGLAPEAPAADAQESRPATDSSAAGSDHRGVSINIGISAEPGSGKSDAAADRAGVPAKDGDAPAAGPHATTVVKDGKTVTDATDPVTGKRTITVVKDGKTVTVTGIPGDREFESFDQLVHTEPALALMIVGIVAVVFLSPVLAIALVLGYRMRKTRMQNETMLKLAEKGLVAPAEAIEAVAAGTAPVPPGGGVAAGGAAAPVERVREIRKRAAWSDLRKGVVMAAIGVGLTLYSVLDDRSPNGIGLVLLFVGVGYIVLWWFEERQVGPRNGGGTPPPGAGPGGTL